MKLLTSIKGRFVCPRGLGRGLRKHLGRVDVAVNPPLASTLPHFPCKAPSQAQAVRSPCRADFFAHSPLCGAFRGGEQGRQVRQVRGSPRRATPGCLQWKPPEQPLPAEEQEPAPSETSVVFLSPFFCCCLFPVGRKNCSLGDAFLPSGNCLATFEAG